MNERYIYQGVRSRLSPHFSHAFCCGCGKACRDRPYSFIATRHTVKDACVALHCVRPGTYGALACGIMHVLFRDGHADCNCLARYSDAAHKLREHLATRTPPWASGKPERSANLAHYNVLPKGGHFAAF